jgi:hypothetical protein
LADTPNAVAANVDMSRAEGPTMGRTAAAITQEFHALTAADFDENDPAADGWARLQALCDEARDVGDLACLPAMFDVMERLPVLV